MKFISDAMHGRIARFLRILGYDTFYPGDLDDSKILEIAKNEGRIIITRDIKLAERAESKGIPVLLLTTVDFIDNLALIHEKFSINLDINSSQSRCPICNSTLSTIPKEQVIDKVPEKTYQHFDKFWICSNPVCQKVYYHGLHWEEIARKLEAVKIISNSKPS